MAGTDGEGRELPSDIAEETRDYIVSGLSGVIFNMFLIPNRITDHSADQ